MMNPESITTPPPEPLSPKSYTTTTTTPSVMTSPSTPVSLINQSTASALTSPIAPTIAAVPHPWVPDTSQNYCYACATEFAPPSDTPHGDLVSRILSGGARRHHCRCCGYIFCQNCSAKRSLIHPDSIVIRGVSLNGNMTYDDAGTRASKALAAREPQRVCDKCCSNLSPSQASLRAAFSNSQRFNNAAVGQNWWNRTVGNSPLAFTLGHEVRKASVTLNNLLPEGRGGVGRSASSGWADDADDDLGGDGEVRSGGMLERIS